MIRVSIGPGGRLGIADDRQAAPADVAGEDQAVVARLGDPDVHRRGAEDVAGVEELEREVLPQVGDAAVGHADHQLLGRDGVGQGVQRLALRARLAAPLEELEVLLLDVRGVREHDRAEVAGRRRGVDGAVEAVPHQQREPARVVDVGVAQDHAVDPARVEGQLEVQRVRLRPPSLEESGVEQESPARGLEQVHRAGHLARRAVEREADAHSLLLVPKRRSPASPRPGRM